MPPMNPSDAPEEGYMGFDMLLVTLMGAAGGGVNSKPVAIYLLLTRLS